MNNPIESSSFSPRPGSRLRVRPFLRLARFMWAFLLPAVDAGSKLLSMEDSSVGKLLDRDDIRLIAELAAEAGVEASLVGGCLRDCFLGRETKDLDFALSGAWDELPRSFAARISGKFFWLDEDRLQGRVVKKRGDGTLIYDFAPLCGASIEDDLRERDFTINALALLLSGNRPELIDPLHGRGDLRQGLIRECSSTSFDDDPLRLLRAIRFSAELGFAIEISTWNSLCAKAVLLNGVSGERIRDELFRTLAAPGCGASLRKLCDSGLWETIHPVQGRDSTEERIARALEVERICTGLGELFPGDGERLAEYLSQPVEWGISLISIIKLAAFLGVEGNKKPLAEKLRLGRDSGKILELLTRDERELHRFLEGKRCGRTVYRFFRDRKPAGPGMLIVARAEGAVSDDSFLSLLGYYLRGYDPEERDLFLSGGEVMDILGIPPGKPVGEAMERLRQAEACGLVNDPEEAGRFIKNLLTKEETIG